MKLFQCKSCPSLQDQITRLEIQLKDERAYNMRLLDRVLAKHGIYPGELRPTETQEKTQFEEVIENGGFVYGDQGS